MNVQSNKPFHAILPTADPTESIRQKIRGFQVPFSERRVLLGTTDMLIVLFAVWGAFYWWQRGPSVTDGWAHMLQRWYWFPLLGLGWSFLAWLNDMYDIPSSNHKMLAAARVATIGLLVIILYLIAYFLSPWSLPRLFFIYFLTLTLPLMTLWRWVYATIFSTSPFRHRVLIVGNNPRGRSMARLLQQQPLINHEVLGFIDNLAHGEAGRTTDNIPILGCESDLMPLIRQMHVHEIVVAIEQNLEKELFLSLVKCQAQGIRVSWMPDLYENLSRRVPIQHIDPAWALYAMQSQSPTTSLKGVLKRVLDVVLILSGFPIVLLLIPIIALAIRLDSPGPIFYRQIRCGLAGKPFSILKFRTMVTDAEKDGKARWASNGDPRITRMGRILRKARLDELPQLLNVLTGEMSIVGPRPERPEFVETLEKEIPFYSIRLLAKPGITGWAQVHYHYGNSIEDAIMKLQYDFYYIRYQSVALDIYTMFRTIGVLLRLKGT